MSATSWGQYQERMRSSRGTSVVASTFSSSPEVRDVFTTSSFTRRKRMSPQERRKQIIQAAAKVIASKGFWGMSLQDVADEIGITESALYHYINTKDDLLSMIIEELYDSSAADDYIYGNAKVEDYDGHSLYCFPRFCLNNVLYNTQRPELVKLFSMLNAESLNPKHPGHSYFINRQQKFWKQISAMNWMLPEPYRRDDNRFHHLWTLSMSAMDGLQLRWLADSSADLVEEWFAFCEVLFPEDLWEGFADPEEYDPASQRCLLGSGRLQQSAPPTSDPGRQPHVAKPEFVGDGHGGPDGVEEGGDEQDHSQRNS